MAGSRSIVCGAFSSFCSLSPHPLLSTVYQCDGCLFFSGGVGAHGWVVRFCQPSVKSPSWSWLPIVEAPGCLGNPTSGERQRCLLKLTMNANQVKCWFLRRVETSQEYLEETSRCRVENQQTQPTYDAKSGN